MNPVGHLLVGAVPVVAYVLARDRSPPTRGLLFVVFVGSLFPELVDKPLAHQFVLIPTGRAFAHSPLVAIPLSVGILLAVRRLGHLREGMAFVFAYGAHVVTDFLWMLEYTPTAPLRHLLWPLLPAPSIPGVPDWAGPGEIYLTLWTAFSIALLSLTVYLLARALDGGTPSRDSKLERQ